MNTPLFTGSGIALITPFRDGNVDWNALANLIEEQIAAGTDALITLGTTGEPATLSTQERLAVAQFTINQAAGRVPVVAGAGSNSTATAVASAQQMQDLGADGLLVVTPYYNKATQAGLMEHFVAVGDAAEVPVILYNVPGRTGVNLDPQTALALSAHPRIVGLKEASGSLSQLLEVARLCRGSLDLYSGNDDQIFTMMTLGGSGVISVAAHVVPRQIRQIVTDFAAGDIESSRQVQESLAPLVAALFSEVSPIPVKAALAFQGKIADELRLPLTPMSSGAREALEEQMRLLD